MGKPCLLTYLGSGALAKKPIQRRQLLRLGGAVLTTVGINQLNLGRQAQQYDRALAQPTQRKLALLVGINDYPDGIASLGGCLNDVGLQYALLIHRYGFNPRDILVLGDSSLNLPGQTFIAPPTRQNILTAFETHLIEQAKSEDVVVFHYSGHGSYVQDKDGIFELNGRQVNGTLVPYDARLQDDDHVDDIMGKTLFLLSLALPANQFTMVLDSCHAGGGIRGNTMIRALDSDNAYPSELELAYQEKWMSRLDLDAETLQQKRQHGVAKGAAMGSTHLGALAAEMPFEDFHAGAFTYLLTRYLWQLPAEQPLSEVFVNIARFTRDVANTNGVMQDPTYSTAHDQDWASRPVYMTNPAQAPAEAVLQDISGSQVSFWLGGMSVDALASQQSVFSLLDDRGNQIGEIDQVERVGLMGRGTLRLTTRSQLQPGQLMREQMRGIPTNLNLRVGIDSSLGDDSAIGLNSLSSIPRVEAQLVTPATPVDYIFGRLTQAAQVQAQQRNPWFSTPLNSLGLLTPNFTPVPDTFGSVDELVEKAIERLRPRLKILLAGKMLGMLINSNVSAVKAEVALFAAGNQTALLSMGSGSVQATPIVSGSVQVPPATEMQVQIKNAESRDLFVSLLSIANTGKMAILHPILWNSPEATTRVEEGMTIQLPDPRASQFRFKVQGAGGFFELLVLVSTEPLSEALRGLQSIARGRGNRAGNPIVFTEAARSSGESEDAPLAIIDALLRDLNQGARSGSERVPIADIQRVDGQHLAAFSIVIEVSA